MLKRASVLEGSKPLRQFGREVLVVWDAADASTDVHLEAALSVATSRSRRERESKAHFREIDAAIGEVMDEIAKSGRAVQKKGESILESAGGPWEVFCRQISAPKKRIAALQ